jgi:hypothetical protein
MTVTNKLYSNFPHLLLHNAIAADIVAASSLNIALMHDYSFNQETHDYWDDVVASECPATGTYAAYGLALTGVTCVEATRVTTLDATDASWAASTIHSTGAIIFHKGASDAASPLACYIDFGAAKDSDNGTFQIQWNASGILTITVAA